ncbi:hypothetical protein [Hymenobacter sp. UYP22]|uniref:hypothetical protein n=1 Tax=Hymenobacter sp. UYP22 TaxID=3156348 RepID=UPI003393D950
MLYLPLPHRRYRPLFFPPGLLALAGLLWLGCVAVPRIVAPTLHVMEVAFPAIHVPASSFGGFPTPQQVEDFGPWKIITLSSNPWAAYFDMKTIESASLALAEEQAEHRALRVYFNESTSYNTFIELWDMCSRLGIKRYWIDWRKQPFSFNLLGNIPPDPNYPSFVCGTSSQYLMPVKSFSELAEEWFKDVTAIDWRNTWLLLLLITALSTRKLTRLRVASRY